MLTRTFLHLSGVGPKRERALWNDNILTWDDLLGDRDLFDDGPPALLERELTLSRRKLAEGDARWFEDRLGHAHSWRLAADFDDGRIVYLDIETDGAAAYEARYRERVVKNLERRAKQLGYKLVSLASELAPATTAASPVAVEG